MKVDNRVNHPPSKPRPQTLKNLRRAVYWVSFPFGILGFVLPIYGKEIGASAVEIGAFFSALSIVPVFVRPFLGRALDKWRRHPFLKIGLAGYAVSMMVFFLSGTVLLLTIVRFIQGVGTAFLWISAFTVVADVARETGRGHDFGVIDESTNRGAVLSPLAGGWFYENLGHATPFYLNTAVLLFGAYLVASFLRETRPREWHQTA